MVNYRGERDDVDNGAVDKLSDVDAALEVGAQMGYDYKLGGGVIGAEVSVCWEIAVRSM